jgi:chromosome segregation ATPase
LDKWLELVRFVQQQFLLSLKRDISNYPVSVERIISGSEEALLEFVRLLFLAQVECEQCEEFLPRILELSEEAKTALAEIVEELRQDPRVEYVDVNFGSANVIVENNTSAEHLKELELEVSAWREKAQASQQELIAMQRNNQHDKGEKEYLKNQLSATRSDSAGWKQKVESLEAQLSSLKRDYDSNNEELGNIRRECNDLRLKAQEIVVMRERVLKASTQLQSSEEECNQLKRRVSELESQSETGPVSSPDVEELRRSTEIYRRNVAMLEAKIKSLEDENSKLCANSDVKTNLVANIHILKQDKDVMQAELDDLKSQLEQLRSESDGKEKELGQFVMTGGALGGQMRDRVIRTLQEQLIVRDEEIELTRQQAIDAQEENRKGERLLISAIHALSLRYHEEMVKRFTEVEMEQNNRTPSPDDFYSQEYNNS